MMTLRLFEPQRSWPLLFVLLGSLAATDGSADDTEIDLTLAIDSPIVVERGGAKVTLIDFEAYLAGLADNLKPAFVADTGRLGKALDSLLLPRQLRMALESESGSVWQKPTFQAELIQSIEKQAAELYLQHLWESEKLQDYSAQAEEVYLTRPDLVRAPVQVDFSHILIRRGKQRSELAAMRGIIDVYDQLSEGAVFGELAQSVSEDNSDLQSRGEYENIEMTSLDEPVRDALARLKNGQISQPFRSDAGWHIVRLDHRASPKFDSFADARPTALRVAEQRHKENFRERVLRRFTSKPVRTSDETLEQLANKYSAQAGNSEDASDGRDESVENPR
mgnify:CR=1 FL=1